MLLGGKLLRQSGYLLGLLWYLLLGLLGLELLSRLLALPRLLRLYRLLPGLLGEIVITWALSRNQVSDL